MEHGAGYSFQGHDVILKLIANLSAGEKNRLQLSGGVKIISIRPGRISGQTSISIGFIVTRANLQAVNTNQQFIRQIKNKKAALCWKGFIKTGQAYATMHSDYNDRWRIAGVL